MTTMPKAQEISRKWYIIDAANRPLGRTAAAAAAILRGKHKVDFAPHVDCGDHVIIINAEKAILTGKKLDQKMAYRHSGRPGGLTATAYRDLLAATPERAVEKAVKGMLPHNSLGRAQFKKLHVYAGPEHPHAGQSPVPYDLTQVAQ